MNPNFDAMTIPDKAKYLRLFVAYPLPEALWRDAKTIHLNNSDVINTRWTPLQNLHITIFFLGEVYAWHVDTIKERAGAEVSAANPFNLELEKISLEHGRKHSGMIWMKFLKNEQFTSLSVALHKSLEEFLLHSARIHDPIPHVTLARWKGHFEAEKVNTAIDQPFQLPEINFCELWQSVSTPDGVIYKNLQRFDMKK